MKRRDEYLCSRDCSGLARPSAKEGEREGERMHRACTLLFFWLGFAQFVFRGQKSVWTEVRQSVIYDYALGNSGNGNICIHRDPVAVNLRRGKQRWIISFSVLLLSVSFLQVEAQNLSSEKKKLKETTLSPASRV